MATTRTRKAPPAIADDYLALVMRFPLVPIRNDRHLDVAHAMIDELSIIDEDRLTEGQADDLSVLSDLTEAYEAPILAEMVAGVTGLDVLKAMVEEHGLSGSDVGRIVGHRELGSKLLKGDRRISREHARAFGKRFGLPPEIFLR